MMVSQTVNKEQDIGVGGVDGICAARGKVPCMGGGGDVPQRRSLLIKMYVT